MKPTASTDFDRIPDKEVPRYVSIFCEQISRILSNNLDFATNFNAVSIPVEFTDIATDTAFKHGLGRVPSGYIVIQYLSPMTIYNGATANTVEFIYLKTTIAGSAIILVF